MRVAARVMRHHGFTFQEAKRLPMYIIQNLEQDWMMEQRRMMRAHEYYSAKICSLIANIVGKRKTPKDFMSLEPRDPSKDGVGLEEKFRQLQSIFEQKKKKNAS